jgi:hypothetical protein
MHQEDIAEEKRIVAELAAPAVTRSQSAQIAATPVSVQPAPILVVPSPLAPIPARELVTSSPLSNPVPAKVPHLDSLLDKFPQDIKLSVLPQLNLHCGCALPHLQNSSTETFNYTQKA